MINREVLLLVFLLGIGGVALYVFLGKNRKVEKKANRGIHSGGTAKKNYSKKELKDIIEILEQVKKIKDKIK
ncbi:hypothetical protein Halha_1095 [Halobacteroides halobius DSM 5150]|uniref:Uncharacterized protein n=1 Tax=Halobacteroides halobius (strain ATCC 35273 / DSM 5150 / MD-1) TaxID=748449 RepID=L0K9K6_HALHC|nr:hypothetical protein [Halobacteroides halobius]AGB41049.1 hypothetical protein Halha_1095 [Halobacteroides halobius DSM 5150]